MPSAQLQPKVLVDLLSKTEIVAAMNHMEVRPYFQQRGLLALHTEHDILTQTWPPIGGVTIYGEGQKSTL